VPDSSLPVGAFRAATKICLEQELKLAPVDDTLVVNVTTKDARVKSVTKTSGGSALPAALFGCLEKQYAKAKLSKSAETFSLTLRLSPAE
jgi:hypothetical protein